MCKVPIRSQVSRPREVRGVCTGVIMRMTEPYQLSDVVRMSKMCLVDANVEIPNEKTLYDIVQYKVDTFRRAGAVVFKDGHFLTLDRWRKALQG